MAAASWSGANSLVQILPVPPTLNGGHQNLLAGHKGKLRRQCHLDGFG